MNAPNAQALADLDAHRRPNGQFGSQPHTDPGIVETPTPALTITAEHVADVIYQTAEPDEVLPFTDQDWANYFPGFGQNRNIDTQVELVRDTIQQQDLIRDSNGGVVDLDVELIRDRYGLHGAYVGVRFRRGEDDVRMLTEVETLDLTDDQLATGRGAAIGIASALLRHANNQMAAFDRIRDRA